MKPDIIIQECCPRDGWQNHTEFISTETKIKYIRRMLEAGVSMLEVTSFVNPKIMPQMADAKEVFAAVSQTASPDTVLTVLTLNKRGIDDAKAAGAKTLEFVLSASEEHNMRNSRRTIAQSMETFRELARQSDGTDVLLCLPCAFGSPFGDEIPVDRLRKIISEAREAGVYTFGLADTAGISTPKHTRDVLRAVKEFADVKNICVHLHDTYGMGIANAYVALEEGITRFDTALAGLGGCPFAPGAKGNIATEDLVYMCEHLGLSTGIDLEALTVCARNMCSEIHATLSSSVACACG